MTTKEKRVLWTASAAHGLIHVYELAVPALLILIQHEFGAGDFTMGRIVTLYGLLFGVGALPAGLLVDRIGSRRLLLFCLWGSSASVMAMAWSPNLAAFALGAACMGCCLSVYHPAGTAWITHAVPLSGRVFAIHGMVGNLGVAGSGVLAGTLGALFGWRWALALLALAGVVLGARVASLPAADPHEIRTRTGGGRWSSFALLLAAITFMGMVYRGMTTFLPKFFATRYADDAASGTAVGGLFTTLALLVGLVGMYVAGRLADRGTAPPQIFLAGAVLQAPLLAALGYAATPALVPLAMGVAFFHFLTQPAGNYMVAAYTPPSMRGLGYGLYFFLSFGAGSAGAALGGWISDRVSLEMTFPALALVLVPSVAATVLLWLVARRSERSSGEL